MLPRIKSALLVSGAFLCFPAFLFGLPEYLARFAGDPFSRPEMRTACATCHLNPAGGGPINDFGRAFVRERYRFTPELRVQWPDRFLASVTASAPAAPVKATWSAGSDEEVMVEISGERYLLNRARLSVKKAEAAKPEAVTVSETPAPVSTLIGAIRNVPTFDYYLVNLPANRLRLPRSLHLRFTHRFSEPLATGTGRLRDLFGFDSFSVSSFGVELGLTKYISFMTYRSPFARSVGGPTIEVGPIFNLLQQDERAPVSLSFRTTVEGQQNFTERFTMNLMPVVSRSIRNAAEFFLAPTFNLAVPRRTLTFDFPSSPGERRDHLASIGLGVSVRIRPRVAVVAEWHPRVAGFRNLASRNPYAFAIQRSTNRHVFALVFSNTQSTTTTRSLTDGLDDFRIGFNLYRRLR